ncbi:MAG: L-threonine 3-dehydrogenase [Dongiaceae bacterium]
MQALVKAKSETGLWQQEVPNPKIGPNDVLIKIKKTAICGTDLHIYKWDAWAARTIPTPMVVGHEYAGVIAEMGSEVKGLKIGQRVSGEGHITCGQCRNCRVGRRHLCPNTIGVGVNRAGAFAEYLAIPAENVFPIPDSIPDEIAAIFDPLGNAVHTALAFNPIGADILITGAGPIGCMAAAICRKVGARHVVVTDINDYRLDLARKMGASLAINVRQESIKDTIAKLGIQEGFDIGLEMSGHDAGLEDLLEHTMNGGQIAILGIFPNKVAIDWDKVIFKGLTLKGIYGREIFNTWYQMVALINSGLDVSPVITHRLNFKEFDKGFNMLLKGQAAKVVMDW